MAASATEFIDITSHAVFIPELWSLFVLDAREVVLVFAKLVDRKFEKDARMGDTIHVQGMTRPVTRTKSLNTAIYYETQSESQTDISIDTHTYAAMAIESMAKIQVNLPLLEKYASGFGYALGLDVDTALAALPDNLSATNSVGTLAVPLTDDDFLRAVQYLDDANAPTSERYIVLSPAQAIEMLKLERMVNRDYESLRGVVQSKKPEQGYVTHFLDMPIYKSTNVEGSNSAGHDNVMFHRETWALIMQMKPTMWNFKDIDYFADKLAMEQVYGYKEMREDHGCWMKGS